MSRLRENPADLAETRPKLRVNKLCIPCEMEVREKKFAHSPASVSRDCAELYSIEGFHNSKITICD